MGVYGQDRLRLLFHPSNVFHIGFCSMGVYGQDRPRLPLHPSNVVHIGFCSRGMYGQDRPRLLFHPSNIVHIGFSSMGMWGQFKIVHVSRYTPQTYSTLDFVLWGCRVNLRSSTSPVTPLGHIPYWILFYGDVRSGLYT